MEIFAYGSNMLSRRLLERAASAAAAGIGFVEGYDLRWHKAGLDGSGKADLFRTDGASARVWGVVYTIDPADRPAIDRAESLGTGYEHYDVRVRTTTGDPVAALAYVAMADAIDDELLPFCWYRDLVLGGAREHGLPEDYVQALRVQACTPDPDAARRARHIRLLR